MAPRLKWPRRNAAEVATLGECIGRPHLVCRNDFQAGREDATHRHESDRWRESVDRFAPLLAVGQQSLMKRLPTSGERTSTHPSTCQNLRLPAATEREPIEETIVAISTTAVRHARQGQDSASEVP